MNLWTQNTPDRFWLCRPDPPAELWQAAIEEALPVLGLSPRPQNVEALLAATLGEGQFGPHPWRLGPARKLYYEIKPFLPLQLRNGIKTALSQTRPAGFCLHWPVEDRYARFQWETLRQLLLLSGRQRIAYRGLWPAGRRFALVLTHDIETAGGQAYAAAVAGMEEKLGFRSSFNFVPERYHPDLGLMNELRARGFEVGVHGLKHDGKLYASRRRFEKRAKRINHYLHEFQAVGFRSPLMHRNPYWLQSLEIEYDLSFFDTDPYEPMPGGVMSLWPYFLGKFVELPYTLTQDSTLSTGLGEKTAHIWLEKLSYIRQMHGMALVNTHPDYLIEPATRSLYQSLLEALCERREEFWHALPRETAGWWRSRAEGEPEVAPLQQATLKGKMLHVEGWGPVPGGPWNERGEENDGNDGRKDGRRREGVPSRIGKYLRMLDW